MERMNIEMSEEILVDYLKDKLNVADKSTVEAWYLESKDNQRLLEQLYFTLFVCDRLGVMESIDVDKSLQEC